MSRSSARLVALSLASLVLLGSAAGCDKVALLAPTGSTVTITVSTTSVAANGSAEVVATVIEAAGTPVHNGTEVRFQVSVGRMEPDIVRTEGGVARATFLANGASGLAKVSAFSGGAKSTEIELRVGSTAAETISVRTTPTFVLQTGGSVQVMATVRDVAGIALPGAQVVFATDNGTLAVGNATTDDQGIAQTTLFTSRESNVRASVAGKEATARVTVINLPTVGLAVSPSNPIAGNPVTITVTPGATTNGNPTQSVTVDFGDGSTPANLGAITSAQSVQHIYSRANSYTITATITDTSGLRQSNSTTITVQAANISISVTGPPSADAGTAVSFTVAVSNPNNATLSPISLNFGNGIVTQLPPTGGTGQTTYQTSGNFTVRASTFETNGNFHEGTHVINIRPRAALAVNLDAAVNENQSTFTCSTTYPKTCNTSLSAFVPPPGGQPGVRVVFTASAAAFATAAAFQWDFNNDGVADRQTTSPSTDFLFTTVGTHIIRARVTTTDGNAGDQHLTLIISP